MDERQVLEELISSYQQEVIAKERELYNNDLFLFNTEVVGFPDVTDPPHRELCRFVEDTSTFRKKLILMPRGHLKSSAVTVSYAIQQVVKDPSVRILIVSGTYQLAVNFVGQIKKIFMRNKKLRELYGEYDKNAQLWRGDSIMVSPVGSEIEYETKEPTILGMGIDGRMTSTHFDIIIMDDVVTRENITTLDQIRKVVMFYRDMQDIWDQFKESSQIIVIGTRWHDGDLYGWLMDNENPENKQMGIMVRQAVKGGRIIRDEKHYKLVGEEKDVLFPRKFSIDKLQKLLDTKGPYEFTTQYFNQIMDDDTATFKRQWLHRYEPDDLRGRVLNKYIVVDPAISQEDNADYTAMVVVGVDVFNKVFVLEVVRDRLTPLEIIDRLFILDERYKPKAVGIESIAFQKSLQYYLQDEFRRRNSFIPIVELKPDSNEPKRMRIQGLQPYYARGDIYHPSHSLNIDFLEDELLRFPYGKNDDMIDALSYFPQLVSPPKMQESSDKHHRYLY